MPTADGHTDSAATASRPVFIDGIGPPLSQIEQDYREILAEADAGYAYAAKHKTEATDILALIAEIKRLRTALGRIADGAETNPPHAVAEEARKALCL